MKKIILLISSLLFLNLSYGQKLLRSSYSEVYNQFKADPDIFKVTNGSAGSSSMIFATFNSGDKYSFTFQDYNNKLYCMTLVCTNNEKTDVRFKEEMQRRKGSLRPSGSYLFYDEQGRGIYYWLSQDDLGRKKINWEAKMPFKFD